MRRRLEAQKWQRGSATCGWPGGRSGCLLDERSRRAKRSRVESAPQPCCGEHASTRVSHSQLSYTHAKLHGTQYHNARHSKLHGTQYHHATTSSWTRSLLATWPRGISQRGTRARANTHGSPCARASFCVVSCCGAPLAMLLAGVSTCGRLYLRASLLAGVSTCAPARTPWTA